jgi:hypothetical protein
MFNWSFRRARFSLSPNHLSALLVVNQTEALDRIIAELSIECCVSLGTEEAPTLTETGDRRQMTIPNPRKFAIILKVYTNALKDMCIFWIHNDRNQSSSEQEIAKH